jgi:hypothetical protein
VVSRATFGQDMRLVTTALRQQLSAVVVRQALLLVQSLAPISHLQIRISARCAIATVLRNITLRVNSDTGANYYNSLYVWRWCYCNRWCRSKRLRLCTLELQQASSANADVFAANVMDILRLCEY